MEEEFRIILEEGTSDAERLYSQINTLLSTRLGTMPLDRSFGMDWSMLSEPIDDAKNDLLVALNEQMEKYIPDIAISEISFKVSAEEGKLIPIIYFERKAMYGR